MEQKPNKVDNAIFNAFAQKIQTAINNCCNAEDIKKVEEMIKRLEKFAVDYKLIS